ncbi:MULTISPECIES: hypothetical protein [Pontibacillus]|uniref:Uncharacterized protein n=1 Tax=Pontibacillus chungwhensis TaxID=265426 RepID=A0ABY8UX99_9BACI|nr:MULTISPECIES: hypothetical protein [Pontibacillus]MCD5325719.1 hypothetical protein [Pontibacillus sp. HN14]WIF98043.1 hypothetical protein QNI29_20330 [Pontibacillus chungwhensis]
MAWLHTIHTMRFVLIGLFSLTATSLFAFQSVEIVEAFMELFTDLFRKK